MEKEITMINPKEVKSSNVGIYPFFGKFQPDMYILKPLKDGESTVDYTKNRNTDILKEFRKIDNEINFVPFIISGTIRFAIRGNFVNDKELSEKHFEVLEDGNHLLTCVWWKDQQFGIDTFGDKLFFKRTVSNSGNSGYDYCITTI